MEDLDPWGDALEAVCDPIYAVANQNDAMLAVLVHLTDSFFRMRPSFGTF